MKLYIYDHCPYCVRVILALGLLKINCPIDYFLNDDEEGPISKVGTKQVPILEKNDGSFMAESLDIIAYLQDFKGEKIIADFSGRKDLSEWIERTEIDFRSLLMPRWVKLDLPEFKTQSSRNYFTNKKTAMIGDFSQNLVQSPLFIKEVEKNLVKLEELFRGSITINEKLSLDDINIWSRLRGLSCVKGLKISPKIKNYLNYYAKLSKVPLYYGREI